MNVRNFFAELKTAQRLQARGFFCALRGASPLFELANVFVRLDHVASFIVNANHGIMRMGTLL
jgi:hypothetical protein